MTTSDFGNIQRGWGTSEQTTSSKPTVTYGSGGGRSSATVGGKDYNIIQGEKGYSADGGKTWASNAQDAARTAETATRAEATRQETTISAEKAKLDVLREAVVSGRASEQQRAEYARSTNYGQRTGRSTEPYYNVGGRRITEPMMAYMDPVEAAAIRQAAATKQDMPGITSYQGDNRDDMGPPIYLPPLGASPPPVGDSGSLSSRAGRTPTAGVAAEINDAAVKRDLLAGVAAAQYKMASELETGANAKIDAFNLTIPKTITSGDEAYALTMGSQALTADVTGTFSKAAKLRTSAAGYLAGAEAFNVEIAAAVPAFNAASEALTLGREYAREEMSQSNIIKDLIGTQESYLREGSEGAALMIGITAPLTILAGPASPLALAADVAVAGAAGFGMGFGSAAMKTVAGVGLQAAQDAGIAPKEMGVIYRIPQMPQMNMLEVGAASLFPPVAGYYAATKGKEGYDWLYKSIKSPPSQSVSEQILRPNAEYELMRPSSGFQSVEFAAGLTGMVLGGEAAVGAMKYGGEAISGTARAMRMKSEAELEGKFKVDLNLGLAEGEVRGDVVYREPTGVFIDRVPTITRMRDIRGVSTTIMPTAEMPEKAMFDLELARLPKNPTITDLGKVAEELGARATLTDMRVAAEPGEMQSSVMADVASYSKLPGRLGVSGTSTTPTIESYTRFWDAVPATGTPTYELELSKLPYAPNIALPPPPLNPVRSLIEVTPRLTGGAEPSKFLQVTRILEGGVPKSLQVTVGELIPMTDGKFLVDFRGAVSKLTSAGIDPFVKATKISGVYEMTAASDLTRVGVQGEGVRLFTKADNFAGTKGLGLGSDTTLERMFKDFVPTGEGIYGVEVETNLAKATRMPNAQEVWFETGITPKDDVRVIRRMSERPPESGFTDVDLSELVPKAKTKAGTKPFEWMLPTAEDPMVAVATSPATMEEAFKFVFDKVAIGGGTTTEATIWTGGINRPSIYAGPQSRAIYDEFVETTMPPGAMLGGANRPAELMDYLTGGGRTSVGGSFGGGPQFKVPRPDRLISPRYRNASPQANVIQPRIGVDFRDMLGTRTGRGSGRPSGNLNDALTRNDVRVDELVSSSSAIKTGTLLRTDLKQITEQGRESISAFKFPQWEPPVIPEYTNIPPPAGFGFPGVGGGDSGGWGSGWNWKPPKIGKLRLPPHYTLLDVFAIEARGGGEARHPTGRRARNVFEQTLATGEDFTEALYKLGVPKPKRPARPRAPAKRRRK